MNKARRKTLSEALKRFQKLRDEFDGAFDDILSEVQGVLDEEQEYRDNMPESLQGGEKGERADEVIGYLEEAVSAMEEIQGIDWDSIQQNLEGAAE